ncbi:unnamed protein product, partial [Rotaria sp. Silwood2]
MTTIVFFIIISILFASSIEANIESCTFNSTIDVLPSNWSYSIVHKVKLCFQSIPVNNMIMNQTIQQLCNSLDFYSFFSRVRQSSSPYFTNVDLRNELLNIQNQTNM